MGFVGVEIHWNRGVFEQIRRLDAVGDELEEAAGRVAETANSAATKHAGAFGVKPWDAKARDKFLVVAKTGYGYGHNRKHNTLIKALGANKQSGGG